MVTDRLKHQVVGATRARIYPILDIFDVCLLAVTVDIVDAVKVLLVVVIGVRRAHKIAGRPIDSQLPTNNDVLAPAPQPATRVIVGRHWRVVTAHAILVTGLVAGEWPRGYLAVIVLAGAGRVQRGRGLLILL